MSHYEKEYDNLDWCTWIEQNILTGKVRFNNRWGEPFEDWTTTKLKDIVTCTNSKHDLHDVDTLPAHGGKYPLYTSSGLYKMVPYYDQEEPYIGINLRGSPGNVFIYHACSSMNSTHAYLNLKDGNDWDLRFVYFQVCQIHWNKYIQGTTIKGMNFKDFKNELIPTPELEEQYRIGNFIQAGSDKYHELEEKIYLMKLFKKGLLQRLFI